MKKLILPVAFAALLLASCSGGSSAGAIDTTDHAAATYCDLSARYDAATGADQALLKSELDELENKIEEAHKGDDAWMKEFESKVEASCGKG